MTLTPALRLALPLFAWGMMLGCAVSAQPDASTDTGTVTDETQQGLRVEVSPVGVGFDYMRSDLPFPAGVAGGRNVVFVGSPFEGRVAAYSRLQGAAIGELPAPPNGFILPFILKSTASNRVTVLDAGGFPSPLPFVPASPTLYEYEYRFDAKHAFSAQLKRSIPFNGALIGFAEDTIKLSDGRYLVNDAVLGSIWIATTNGTIKPGIVPRTFARADAIPQMAFCDSMPVIQVGGRPFLFTASSIPGITAMAERNGKLYFSSSCLGGVYSVPLASLDDARQPYQRAADIRLVSAKPAGVAVEELLGVTFNPDRPDEPYLYAADALQLRVIRINVDTGARQVVGDDPVLYNFPSSLAFLPPLVPHSPVSQLVVVSNQQHLTPLTNDAIFEDAFEPPFLVTQVLIAAH